MPVQRTCVSQDPLIFQFLCDIFGEKQTHLDAFDLRTAQSHPNLQVD
jgi:hypothetical protein